MLGLYAFNSLSLPDQLNYLQDEGRYLARRNIGSYYLKLYDLGSFYVELKYSLKTNQLEDVRTFISKKNLGPYLPFPQRPE